MNDNCGSTQFLLIAQKGILVEFKYQLTKVDSINCLKGSVDANVGKARIDFRDSSGLVQTHLGFRSRKIRGEAKKVSFSSTITVRKQTMMKVVGTPFSVVSSLSSIKIQNDTVAIDPVVLCRNFTNIFKFL